MFKERFAKLIDVKTLVTFSVVATIIYLSVIGKIEPGYVTSLGTMVVGFYFGVKKEQADASKVAA